MGLIGSTWFDRVNLHRPTLVVDLELCEVDIEDLWSRDAPRERRSPEEGVGNGLAERAEDGVAAVDCARDHLGGVERVLLDTCTVAHHKGGTNQYFSDTRRM